MRSERRLIAWRSRFLPNQRSSWKRLLAPSAAFLNRAPSRLTSLRPFPITPLTETGFPALFGLDKEQQSDTQGVRRFYGRLYINEGAILHNLVETYGIPPSFISKMWGSHRKGKTQVTGKWRPLRLFRGLPTLLRQGFSATKSKGPRQTPQEFFAQIDAWVNEFLQKDLSLLDDRALWAEGLPIWSERGASVFATNIRISTPAGLMLSLLERIVSWWTKLSKLVPDLVTGLPGIYSAEVGPALWRMAPTLAGHLFSPW